MDSPDWERWEEGPMMYRSSDESSNWSLQALSGSPVFLAELRLATDSIRRAIQNHRCQSDRLAGGGHVIRSRTNSRSRDA